ncbi:MAG: NAD-dependent epimerase/dehydratase family protein [Acidobacteria bacterium]|nr:MAG: NAD-dependent epimerase/dehydratase family protein [Acidobacteriota bacterium]
MKRVLVIGGTRNLGHLLCLALLEQGWDTTILNRGLTPDELPGDITRFRADRQDAGQLKSALHGKTFDAVVDTTLYNGKDAQLTVDLLHGQTGLYVFLSSGQVYLVRTGVERPFKEEDYRGTVMPPPTADPSDYRNWKYGVEKREVEDVLDEAWAASRFPCLSLRLPMVNSERDHYHRLYGYLLRIWDGGPILVPDGPHLSLRHVYGGDVVALIIRLIGHPVGVGNAWNVGQDETVTLEQFLPLLRDLDGGRLNIRKIAPEVLKKAELIPACSPFSDPWMSELDNRKSKQELGARYTPLGVYLEKLVRHYRSMPRTVPPGYARREEELKLAENYS